jgi:hypothetical protein
MRLVNFSDKRKKLPANIVFPQVPLEEHFAPKPRGLWVSDEDDYGWAQWCQAESFRRYRLRFAHDVTLRSDANVLMITDHTKLLRFHHEYIMPPPEPLRALARGRQRGAFSYMLDWPRLARHYQGIIITPYRWEERLGYLSWYYTWDCASGVIWDTAAIATFRSRVFGPFPRTGKRGKPWAEKMADLRAMTEQLRSHMNETG